MPSIETSRVRGRHTTTITTTTTTATATAPAGKKHYYIQRVSTDGKPVHKEHQRKRVSLDSNLSIPLPRSRPSTATHPPRPPLSRSSTGYHPRSAPPSRTNSHRHVPHPPPTPSHLGSLPPPPSTHSPLPQSPHHRPIPHHHPDRNPRSTPSRSSTPATVPAREDPAKANADGLVWRNLDALRAEYAAVDRKRRTVWGWVRQRVWSCTGVELDPEGQTFWEEGAREGSVRRYRLELPEEMEEKEREEREERVKMGKQGVGWRLGWCRLKKEKSG